VSISKSCGLGILDGERRPLANSTDLQNRNCGLGILEIDLAMLLEAFFSPKKLKI
jgi:hypothetical protein